jgi:uncharacterized 2Fe-2S/4Fe-4S cluster protein (DUF4445 family)
MTHASVAFEPFGRRVDVEAGTTILAAAREAGVELASTCGGQGTCGRCRVNVVLGTVGSPSDSERVQLSADELDTGTRLACQARVESDVRVDIPWDSLATTQRLQLEGEELDVELDPPVVALDFTLTPPALDDLRADASRLLEVLEPRDLQIALPVLADLPEQLRAEGWSARAAIHLPSAELLAVRPSGSPLLGLAIDLGTTKLAAYLVDLESGRTLARAGAMNPQIAYGEDVVSRIACANTGAAARQMLQELVVGAVDRLARELCPEPAAIIDCVVVGNTAMHHLFAGLPVRQLGEAPYVAAVSGALEIHAADVGLGFAPGATLYIPPLIAGYVGADHVAVLLATRIDEAADTVLALDIGTNTEISLAHGGHLWTCATASGPAFEGAHISEGMRAAPGAIERVHYRDGSFFVQTVDNRPPTGICGSGILDAVAEALRAGIIDARGALARSHPSVAEKDGQAACVIVPAALAGHNRDVAFTRADVGEIQLAKAAIHAGTELLLAAAGIGISDLDRVVVAGAFGTYLDVRSAIRIGLLPDIPAERFRQVGNAAGAGARQLLLSRTRRRSAVEVARRAQYLELTTHPEFADAFAEATRFS